MIISIVLELRSFVFVLEAKLFIPIYMCSKDDSRKQGIDLACKVMCDLQDDYYDC